MDFLVLFSSSRICLFSLLARFCYGVLQGSLSSKANLYLLVGRFGLKALMSCIIDRYQLDSGVYLPNLGFCGLIKLDRSLVITSNTFFLPTHIYRSLLSSTPMIMRFRATSANDFAGVTPFVFGFLADGLAFSADLCRLVATASSLYLGKTAFAQSMDSWSSFVSSSLVGGSSSPFLSRYAAPHFSAYLPFAGSSILKVGHSMADPLLAASLLVSPSFPCLAAKPWLQGTI